MARSTNRKNRWLRAPATTDSERLGSNEPGRFSFRASARVRNAPSRGDSDEIAGAQWLDNLHRQSELPHLMSIGFLRRSLAVAAEPRQHPSTPPSKGPSGCTRCLPQHRSIWIFGAAIAVEPNVKRFGSCSNDALGLAARSTVSSMDNSTYRDSLPRLFGLPSLRFRD